MNLKKYLFISVKPEFANKIVDKEKTIELRKVKPHVHCGDYVIIYASSPAKEVIGFGIIKSIIDVTPEKIWNEYADNLGIDKARFDAYYKGSNRAVGIVIDSIRRVNPPISLSKLRSVDATFHPPQIYRYVSNYFVGSILSDFLANK